ncbi:unnamed protein product, partial [marine sediment metagenome]
EIILQGKEPSLELNTEYELNSDLDIFIDGQLWNREKIQQVGKMIEFKKDGQTLWSFAPPRAWDIQENMENTIDGTTILSANEKKLNLTVYFPYSWLKDAQYPVTIDPDTYYGETTDGHIYGRDTDYDTARTTSFAFDVTSDFMNIGQLFSSPKLYRQKIRELKYIFPKSTNVLY